MPVVPAAHRAKKLAIHLGGDGTDRVTVMLDRQNLTGLPASRKDVPAGSIGCLGAAELPPEGNVLFFTGVPINGPDARDVVDAEAAARLFPAYDGGFTGVFWDAQRQILVVATDCLGMQPLYMRYADGELTLVSETKALTGSPDLAAWGAFISIGHPIGERSLLSGLRRVPPASVLVYDCDRRELTVNRYWDWPQSSDAWRGYDFLESLEQDVRGYTAFGDPGTLLLSGGFDSRLILFLLKRARVPADALIVVHEDEHGDADGRLAERVARYSAIRYRKVRPSPDFFSSSGYLDYLNASDVGYPSLDLFIAKVVSWIDGDAVWDGLAPGFVFMPLHQPEGGFKAYLQQEIRGPDGAAWRAARMLFRPEIADAMFEGFSDDLKKEVDRLPQDAGGLARFVIENRSRNRASMNPLKVYANRALSYTPGLSKDFMAHAAVIPFAQKQGARLYLDLFERLDRRALTTPFLSGSKLMKATPFGHSYYPARARIEFHKYLARYPNALRGLRRIYPTYVSRRSDFLGAHLLEERDAEWLNPDIEEKLHRPDAGNYLAWKLLFHWKAWAWVHEGRLKQMMASESIRMG